MMGKDGYLKEAKRIFRHAKREYESARVKRNKMKARQAAEKGYLCLMKLTNALFIEKGVTEDNLPRNERGRIHFLKRYGDRDVRRKYQAIRHSFHIDAFYDEIVDFKILEESFDDLEGLIKNFS